MSTQQELDLQARLADMERQIAELNSKVNPAWFSGIDQLARTGKLQFGGPFGGGTVQIGPDGLEIVSATSPLNATQKDRYLRWFDKLNGTVIGKFGTNYSAGLGAVGGTWLLKQMTDSGLTIGFVDDPDSASPTYRVYMSIFDVFDSGADSGFNLVSRSYGSATERNILQVIPHGATFPGRVKVGYDAASTDDIIALVLDNADDTNDLPTASSTLRGGLALVEGSPDKVYVCRSTDGGSTFEWTQLGGGGMSLIVKEADETVNNSDTLQDDAELLFAVLANEVWQFEGVLRVTVGTAEDFRLTFTGPTGAVGSFAVELRDDSSGLVRGGAALGTTAFLSPAAAAGTVHFWGGIHNGANAGNLTLQWAQRVATVVDTKVLAGSYIKYQLES